jgi:hypothetical protein
VLYNGQRRWNAPLQLEQLIHPAPAGLEKYRLQVRYLLLDEGRYHADELSSLTNLVAALFQLENSRTEQEIQGILVPLIDWLKDPKQTSLRRAFTVWFNRVLLPAKAPDAHFTELNDLNEVNTMLAERVRQWTQEWKQEGIEEGRQEEASKLFLLLLESRFGAVNQQLQEKVRTSNPERIEAWIKQIFQAKTPEDLLDS